MTTEKYKEILRELNVEFSEKTSNRFNFRCFVCGDSKRTKSKKRGWLLVQPDGGAVLYCHNCGHSSSFRSYLKENHSDIYKRHLSDFLTDISNTHKVNEQLPTVVEDLTPELNLVKEDISYILEKTAFPIYSKVKSLKLKGLQIYCLRYLLNRKIPKEKIRECFISYDDYLNKETGEITRIKNKIIFPFYKGKTMYAFQARDLRPDSMVKYLTVKCSNELKIYNYFGANPNEPVIILEGPINSFFVENSIATCGTITPNSNAYNLIKNKFPRTVWAFDNDEAGWKRIDAFLSAKEACFIFPNEWKKYKDINDIVLDNSLTNKQITDTINDNIYTGLKGQIKLKLLQQKEK